MFFYVFIFFYFSKKGGIIKISCFSIFLPILKTDLKKYFHLIVYKLASPKREDGQANNFINYNIKLPGKQTKAQKAREERINHNLKELEGKRTEKRHIQHETG